MRYDGDLADLLAVLRPPRRSETMRSILAFRFAYIATLVAVAVVDLPATAHAHAGVGSAHDLLHGLEHPFTGIDHMCAMLAVGIWAAQRGGRAVWLVPLSFISVMTLGDAIAAAGAQLPLVEPGIVLSLVVLGMFMAAAVRLPLVVSMAIVSLFALVHGYAHGLEIPAAASGVTYAAGFILATAGLTSMGIAFGLLMRKLDYSPSVRLAGAAIALCGVYIGIQ
jgi:urease accessory protein